MTELKQKAIKKASELNLQNVSLSGIVRNRIVDILVEFATETTKELQEQIENLQIMLQAEREVRCNTEYLKKVTELEEENERLKKDSEENQNLATIAYMQGAGKYKAKLDKAKEIIRKLCGTVRALNNPNTQLTNVDVYLADTESFLKE